MIDMFLKLAYVIDSNKKCFTNHSVGGEKL